MQRSDFLNRLMVDFKANPKKVVVLGVLFAVAAYFWAPLFGKLFSKSPTKTATNEPYMIADLVVGVETTAVPQEQDQSWREVTHAIADDPNTKPAPEMDWARDPFEMHVEVEVPEEGQAVAEDPPIEAGSDAQAQVLLKGTLVSSNKKTALINSDSYQEGETIDFGEGFAVRVNTVASRYVVLEANGVRIELQLNTPTVISASQFAGSPP